MNCVILLLLLINIYTIGVSKHYYKIEFCANLDCKKEGKDKTCGIRVLTEDGFQLRLFESLCELLNYGCQVEDEQAYGLTNTEYCQKALKNTSAKEIILKDKIIPEIYEVENSRNVTCLKYECSYEINSTYVCGIREVDNGFKVRLFKNECLLRKYNCEKKLQFTITDSYICDELKISDSSDQKVNENNRNNKYRRNVNNNNLFIIDSSLINYNNDINDTIDDFFAATHVFDLPVKEVSTKDLNIDARRMLLNRFGPQKVFKPWITIPKNISDDHYHRPTLSSCYHTCPKKCPETYAPVCGVPGIVAREPSLMFKNHCFMDIAQCKMFWEDKSDTARSSSYIESSFLFCLGDEMNGLYRFLPLVRTLQHMGRLKKKGHFRYKMKNLRFFNNLLSREPKLMG